MYNSGGSLLMRLYDPCRILLVFRIFCLSSFVFLFFFFFQAEDGIRDIGVTGVQTCALPIYFEISQRAGIAIEACTFLGSSFIRFFAEGWTLDKLLKLTEEAVTFAVSEGQIGRASCRERV